MSRNKRNTGNLVPFMQGSTQAFVNPNKLNWTTHHGKTASGTQVNSLKTATFGDSIIIDDDVQKKSFKKADFEVMGVDVLKAMGYTVTPPAAQG